MEDLKKKEAIKIFIANTHIFVINGLMKLENLNVVQNGLTLSN